MNILIINAHSSKNKGDAGIVLSMIDALQKNNPGCSIRINSRFPDIDKDAYNHLVNSCVENVSIDPKTSKVKKSYSAIKLLLALCSVRKIKSEDYEWADVVVSCGGGFLLSHGFSVALLQHLVQITTAFSYKKPVVIYSQSIGPFYNRFMQVLAGKVLEKIDKIYIREKVSQDWLTKIGCKSNKVEIVPDSAFAMEDVKSKSIDELVCKIKQNHNGPFIGMTVRDWNFPEVSNSEDYRAKYIESIRAGISYISTECNGKVLLMPQVLGPNPFNDDRIISREILEGIPLEQAQLLDYDFSPRELKYLYSKMDMFVGTRMHSNIFALSNLVPTVAINYEHKTKGIMEMLDLNDYVIDIKDINPSDFLNMLKECWDNQEKLHQILTEKMPQVIEDAQIPAKKIREVLSNR